MTDSMKRAMKGVFPVLPCIFDAHGEVDERGLHNVLEYAIRSGADGVVFPGLASEYDCLTPDERDHLVSRIGEWTGNRVQFVVGASADSTEAVTRFAARGAQAHAAAAMIMTPHALAGDPNGLREFFMTVGRASTTPIMLQNAPRPMGIGLSVDAIARLVHDVPAIQFVKEETPPCGQRITELLGRAPAGLRGVFGGAGGRYVIDELNRGAAGTMPASELTEIHVAMLAAHGSGDFQRARDLFERCLPLLNMQATFRWRLTKEVLRRRGLIESTHTRAPGPVLDAHDLEELDELLRRLADLTGRLGGPDRDR